MHAIASSRVTTGDYTGVANPNVPAGSLRRIDNNAVAQLRKLQELLSAKEDVFIRFVAAPGARGASLFGFDLRVDGMRHPTDPISTGEIRSLMSMGPPEAWASNQSIRTAIQKGRIEVLTLEEAEAVQQKREEPRRRSLNDIKEITAKDLKIKIKEQSEGENVAIMADAIDMLDEHGGVKPRIVGMIMEANAAIPEGVRLSEGDMQAELDLLDDILDAKDLAYVSSAAPYSSIRQWASARLS